jgi:hypothetical protein
LHYEWLAGLCASKPGNITEYIGDVCIKSGGPDYMPVNLENLTIEDSIKIFINIINS